MGFVSDTPRGKRPRDANINLVPYVDVLMTLMAFLVMCAAWTALSAIDARVSGAGAGDHDPAPTLTIELRRESEIDRDRMRAFKNDNADAQLLVRVEDGVAFQRLTAVLDVAQGLGYPPPAVEAM